MKNLFLYIASAVMFIAIVALYVLFFTKEEPKTVALPAVEDGVSIAYIRTDSLLLNYDKFKAANEALLKQRDNAKATLEKKDEEFQRDKLNYLEKVEKQAFLSMDRQRSEYERLVLKEQELQKLEMQMAQELMQKEQQMLINFQASMDSLINEFNKEKGFTFIFGTAGNNNILYGNEMYNVTNEVLNMWNNKKE
jgi:outer membrane protein